MSEAECVKAVGDSMEKLVEQCMNWKKGVTKLGTKNALLKSFHNAHATLVIIQHEICSSFMHISFRIDINSSSF